MTDTSSPVAFRVTFSPSDSESLDGRDFALLCAAALERMVDNFSKPGVSKASLERLPDGTLVADFKPDPEYARKKVAAWSSSAFLPKIARAFSSFRFPAELASTFEQRRFEMEMRSMNEALLDAIAELEEFPGFSVERRLD